MYNMKFLEYVVKIGFLYWILLLNCKSCSFCFRVCNYSQGIFKPPIHLHKSVYSDLYNEDSTGINQQILVADKIPLRNLKYHKPISNVHPNFCLNDYYIFDISVYNFLKDFPRDLMHSLVSYLYLLSKSKISLHEFGVVKLSKRTSMNNVQNENSNVKDLEYYLGPSGFYNSFSNQTLFLIKEMQSTDDMDDSDEFISNLKNQPIGTYDVVDLISDTPYNKFDIKELKNSLKDYICNSFDKPTFDSIQPINWIYVPRNRKTYILFYLKNIDLYLKMYFKMSPKNFYTLLDSCKFKVFKLAKKIYSNSNDQQNNKQQESTQNELEDQQNKQNNNSVEEQQKSTQNDQEDQQNKQDYDSLKYIQYSLQGNLDVQNVFESDLNFKNPVIGISKVNIFQQKLSKFLVKDKGTKNNYILVKGHFQNKFNLILKLLLTLYSNLPCNKIQNNNSERKNINCKMNNIVLRIKIIRVYVNSKFKFVIPLITYFDLRDGNAYLCNKNIPIEANPEVGLPLISSNYSKFNKPLVPNIYRESVLFSSKDMKFKDEDILKLLSSYKYFKKFVYNKINNNDKISNSNDQQNNKQQEFTQNEQEEQQKEQEQMEQMERGDQQNQEKDSYLNSNEGDQYDDYRDLISEYGSDSSVDESEPDLKFEKQDNKNIENDTNNQYHTYIVNEKYKMFYKNDGNSIKLNLLLE